MKRYSIAQEKGRRVDVVGFCVGVECLGVRRSDRDSWLLDHVPSGELVGAFRGFEQARTAARELRRAFGERLDASDFGRRLTGEERVRCQSIVIESNARTALVAA